jgi:hypothetical protein
LKRQPFNETRFSTIEIDEWIAGWSKWESTASAPVVIMATSKPLQSLQKLPEKHRICFPDLAGDVRCYDFPRSSMDSPQSAGAGASIWKNPWAANN